MNLGIILIKELFGSTQLMVDRLTATIIIGG